MADPTPKDYERANAIAAAYIDPEGFAEKIVYDPGDINSQQDIRYLIDRHAHTIAVALAAQRERDAGAVEAVGERHADLRGEEVPRRVASIAATYLRSGYEAADVRKADA